MGALSGPEVLLVGKQLAGLREHDGHEEVEEEVRHDEHVQDEEEPRLRFKPAADGSRRKAELVRVRLSRGGRGNALNRAYECGRPYQGTSGPRATTCIRRYGWRFRGDQFRVPWPQKYHHARASVGYCKGISASTCQRRAQECATQSCGKPSPRSANPNPTCLRDNTSGRPRVGAGGLFPYPSTHGRRLVPMLGPGHA